MLPRLIGGGVALIAVVGVLGIGFALRPDPRLHTPADKATSRLARSLNNAAQRQSSAPRVGWTVTRATSAHKAMVVDVEAERLDEAGGIAIQIVEPVISHGYEEILIYVRQPGARVPMVRRIQWTPRGGYVESTYPDR